MQRRDLLGTVATLPALPAPEGESDSDPRPESDPDQRPRRPRKVLDEASTFALIERYDWEGTIRVKSYPQPDEYAAVEVFVRGEWGEAGVGLTATEARTLIRELAEAVEASEDRW